MNGEDSVRRGGCSPRDRDGGISGFGAFDIIPWTSDREFLESGWQIDGVSESESRSRVTFVFSDIGCLDNQHFYFFLTFSSL